MRPLTFTLTRHFNGGRPVVRLERTFHRVEGDPVPAGFETDFASTFPLLGMLSPALAVFGRSCVAAVGHDWDCARRVDRGLRSARFLRQMLRDGVPRLQAEIQWAAVRFWPGSESVRAVVDGRADNGDGAPAREAFAIVGAWPPVPRRSARR